ncbi:DNA-binding transcriptional regulator DsdC [Pseudomonas sp. R5(2019)]|uniref:DNA-binding transcriptional regulator DsdC n=1 Tax=Pseudomonas sp. R5(2019) TaxID=2697566 RepID=UPI001411F3C0|nr:DNA-binding transcriptional regulator DsdC [Pseudomonas sp. R5(2019)]NBA93914.1 DNA-binding transcriptional regulator DsdC [Pseudomonas sp. R5(2019)]
MNKLSGVAALKLNGSHLGSLHVFLVAARHMSFSRAADELCLTASAVSHRINRLEEDLSLKLFHRMPRKVSLTEDGERLFSIMQRTMDELSEAVQERSHAEIAGQLTFYVRPSVAQCWVIPRLAKFTSRYPDIQLDIRVGNESIDYRTRKIDLVLCYSDGNHPGLASIHLMSERIAPVCSPLYAETNKLTGDTSQLSRCTALHDIAAWDNAAFDAEWQLWADSAGSGINLPRRFLTFDRSDLCTIASLNHAGLAMGREQLVRERITRGELVLPFGDFVDTPNYGYYLVHPHHDPMPKRLQVLIDWLVESASESSRSL